MFAVIKIVNGEPDGWVIAASRDELLKHVAGDPLVDSYLRSHFDEKPGKYWISPEHWLLIY